jgi:hypothetical protein
VFEKLVLFRQIVPGFPTIENANLLNFVPPAGFFWAMPQAIPGRDL